MFRVAGGGGGGVGDPCLCTGPVYKAFAPGVCVGGRGRRHGVHVRGVQDHRRSILLLPG